MENKRYKYNKFLYNDKWLFKKELLSDDAELIKMLDNELYMWQLLKKYDFIPQILFFDNKDSHYIIYQYIDGVTLDKYKFKDDKEKLTIFVKILEKIEVIHNLFIVHCDLKASNIIISNNNIYILDFGNAKFIGDKTNYGTPRYCSVSQLKKEKITYNFDIYSLGIILYELLTSKPSFKDMNIDSLIKEKEDSDLELSDDKLNTIFYKMTNGFYNDIKSVKKELLESSIDVM